MADFQAVALVPAAGEGRRMGPGTAKVFREIHGEPVLIHTLRALGNVPEIDGICLVAPAGEEDIFRQLLARFGLSADLIVAGGTERQNSVANGLNALSAWVGWHVSPEERLVAIHDAARPLIEPETIGKAVRMAAECGAVGVGVRVKDTIKQTTREGVITGTPDRSNTWAIQTPQIFRLPLVLDAHRAAESEGFIGTDDCVLVERTGYPVRIIEGDYRNIKITTPEDIAVAETLSGVKPSYRVGQGFDVHQLVPDRKLILGGVAIDYERGLLGHSDADVLIHAVMDALLGAVGLGDIGQHFPDTDPRYKGADSRKLLVEVGKKVAAEGYRVVNVDATIIAQRPKVAGYVPQMRRNMAEDLGINAEDVNVKATTTEGLGFTGRGEGIAAMAVAMAIRG